MNYVSILFAALIALTSSDTHAFNSETIEKSAMLGLRTTVYSVDDINNAKKWYANAFEIQPYFDEAYYVGFNVSGFELGLMPKSKESLTGNNVIAYWGVADAEATYKRLISLGAKPHTPIYPVGGGIKLGSVLDPFGNVLGIIYNPIFKAN